MIFGGGPSLRDIDDFSIALIDDRIGGALEAGVVDMDRFYDMLDDMASYASEHGLGTWKTSRMLGNLEMFLSQAVGSNERTRLLSAAREHLN